MRAIRGPAVAVRLPTFLIIGAMRSGTTSLAHSLRAHPDIFMPSRKELHFFDFNFHRGVQWYASNFDRATTERAIGEATPNLMYLEEALPRMAEVVPDAALIAILRNPVDRAYSHYWYRVAIREEHLGFREALAAERQRLDSGDLRSRARYSYLDRGRYLRQLLRVCEYYRREALKVLLFEDLRGSPLDVYRSLCGFLGVAEDVETMGLDSPSNSFRMLHSRTVRRVSSRMPRKARRFINRLNTRELAYPPLDPSIRAELLADFEEDNAALASWLGRDLSHWRR